MNDNEGPMPHRRKGESGERDDGGVDGEKSSMSNGEDKTLVPEPKSIYGLIWRIIEKFGLSAVVIVGMGGYVYWLQTSQQRFAAVAHDDFKAALGAQTAAVKESTAEQHRMTEAMVELKVRLESHMRREEADDRRR